MSEHYSIEAVLGYLTDESESRCYANGVLVRHDMYREIIHYLEEIEKNMAETIHNIEEMEKNMAVKSSKKAEEIIEDEITEETDGFESISETGDEDGQSVQELQGQTSEWSDGTERRSRRSNRRS